MAGKSLHFLPRDLRKALKPFQREGIRYGIEKNGRCLIGDEMGLGKTLQALSIAYYYRDEWPLLIIVPSSLKYTWVDEIEKWLPEVPPEDINLIKSASDLTALKKAKINIISYGLISLRNNLNAALIKGIQEAKFGVGIVDESHFIKSRKTTRTQKIIQLLKHVKRVILLTGTPSLARPEELFSQISVIRPGLIGNWQYFGERYCDGHYILQTARGGKVFRTFDTRGASNLKELHDILKNNVMIRRLKQDVLTELPAKRRQRISFEIGQDSERKKNLEKSLESFKGVVTKFKKQLNENTEGKLVTMNDVYSSMIVLFKHTGLAKAGAIQEYISDLLDGMPNKFIVFCYHLDVISAVTELLAKRNIRYVRIAGDVPPEVRANYVKEFQNNPICRVAVLSITASCMGITLTAADHVVFAELHWTPGVIKQAEDRCHRIGQKNSVQVHFLTARGTIDEVMWSMLSRKLTVTSETLDGETQLLSADDGDHGMDDLLSLCDAWLPDDDDEDIDLFTPRPKKDEMKNQKDIRACFSQTQQPKQQGIKRKTRDYYQQGFLDISASSDAEFKPEYKRSKKIRKTGNEGKSGISSDVVQLVIDSDDDLDATNPGKESDTKDSLCFNNTSHQNDLTEDNGSNSNAMLRITTQDNDQRKSINNEERLEENISYNRQHVICKVQNESDSQNETENKRNLNVALNEVSLIDLKNSAQREKCNLLEGFKSEAKIVSTRPNADNHYSMNNQVEHILNENDLDSLKGNFSVNDCSKSRFLCSDNEKPSTTVVSTASVKTEKGGYLPLGKTANVHLYTSNTITDEVNGERLLALTNRKADSVASKAGISSKFEFCCPLLNRPSSTSSYSCLPPPLAVIDKPEGVIEDSAPGDRNDGKIKIASLHINNENEVADNNSALHSSSSKRYVENEDAARSWSCIACTFDNHEELNCCEMCGTMRPVARVTTRSNAINGIVLETGLTTKIRKKKRNEIIDSQSDELEDSLQDSSQTSTLLDRTESDINTSSDDISSSFSAAPLKNGAKGIKVETNKICTASNTSMEDFTSIRDQVILNEADKDSFVELMSVSSESSTDVEEDWTDTSKACIETPVEEIIFDIGARNPSVPLNSSPCNDAEKSSFCVSDAFSTGRFSAAKDDADLFGNKTTNTSTSPPNKVPNRSLIERPLIFSSHDHSGNCKPEKTYLAGFKSASQLLHESELADLERGMFDEDFQCEISEQGINDRVSVPEKSGSSVSSAAMSSLPLVYAGSDGEARHDKNFTNKCRDSSFASECDNIEDDDIGFSDALDDDISIISSEKSDTDIEDEEEEIAPIDLRFKMSFESDRVYLYNEDEESLGINFRIPDVGIIINDNLPRIFSHPYNLQQLKKFSRQWSSLTTTMQRQVRKAGFVFRNPLQVYDELKQARYGKSSKERFTSKAKINEKVKTIADFIGGTVREIKQIDNQRYNKKSKNTQGLAKSNPSEKPAENDNDTLLQAVDSDGSPICLFCNGKVQNGFRAGLLEARFCSYNCKEEYLFRTSKSRIVREKLFAAEKGVCQKCKFDSHGLFARITALRKKDRRSALEMTHFKDLSATLLNKIIMDPKEGQFWEADHITAVSEGGGECGLDNYRTLCVPCHKDVTKDLNKRLQKNKRIEKARAEGNRDIGAFLKPSSSTSTKGAVQQRPNTEVGSEKVASTSTHSSAKTGTATVMSSEGFQHRIDSQNSNNDGTSSVRLTGEFSVNKLTAISKTSVKSEFTVSTMNNKIKDGRTNLTNYKDVSKIDVISPAINYLHGLIESSKDQGQTENLNTARPKNFTHRRRKADSKSVFSASTKGAKAKDSKGANGEKITAQGDTTGSGKSKAQSQQSKPRKSESVGTFHAKRQMSNKQPCLSANVHEHSSKDKTSKADTPGSGRSRQRSFKPEITKDKEKDDINKCDEIIANLIARSANKGRK